MFSLFSKITVPTQQPTNGEAKEVVSPLLSSDPVRLPSVQSSSALNRLESEVKIRQYVSTIIQSPYDYTLTDSRRELGWSMAEAVLSDQQHEVDEADNELCFYVLGCTGSGTEHQKKVGKLMEEVAEREQQDPAFMLMLGDQFYECGVDSPFDSAFKRNFDDIYPKDIAIFPIPGNHCHDAHKHKIEFATHFVVSRQGGVMNYNKISGQVGHTFIDDKDQLSQDKINLYDNKILDLSLLPAWNMSRRFGVLRLPENNLEIFMVDSTTFVKDYIAYMRDLDKKAAKAKAEAEAAKNAESKTDAIENTEKKIEPTDNEAKTELFGKQAEWLAEAAKQNPNTIKFISLHHPLHDAVSKRVFKTDAELYLSDVDFAALVKLGITERNYNKILYIIICERLGLKFQTAFSAHNHSISYSQFNGMSQIVSGGGGGELQDRDSFRPDDRATVSCFLRNQGFVKVRVNEGRVLYDIYTVDRHHLRLDQHGKILRDGESESVAVQRLREIIVLACNQYMDFVNRNQSSYQAIKLFRSIYHGTDGAFRADDLKNFFNRYKHLSLDECINYLKESLQRITRPDPNSLVSYISDCLFNKYQFSYNDLIDNPNRISEISVAMDIPRSNVINIQPAPMRMNDEKSSAMDGAVSSSDTLSESPSYSVHTDSPWDTYRFGIHSNANVMFSQPQLASSSGTDDESESGLTPLRRSLSFNSDTDRQLPPPLTLDDDALLSSPTHRSTYK